MGIFAFIWSHLYAYIFFWGIFIISFLVNRSRLRNSFYLGIALIYTIWDIGITGSANPKLATLLLTIIGVAILVTLPFLFMVDGLYTIKHEGRALTHMLPLALGIAILLGELAVLYFFTLGERQWFDKPSHFLGATGIIGVFGASIFYLCYVFANFMIYTIFIMHVPHRHNFDYLVVHGCGLLKGEKVSPLLASRLNKAIQVYKTESTPPKIITSGGQGGDEKLPEAHAMALYLIDNGIPPENIIEEDKSKDTMENVVNVQKIINARGGNKRTALISSNYHVYRCLVYARKVKLKCTGIGSKTAFYYWPSALIREFAAIYSEPFYLFFLILGWLPCLELLFL